MTRFGLAVQIAKELDISRAQAFQIVDVFFSVVANALEKSNRVEIRGFGSFSVKTRKARTGRNPRTGERIYVPSKKIPHFKAGSIFKKALFDRVKSNPAQTRDFNEEE